MNEYLKPLLKAMGVLVSLAHVAIRRMFNVLNFSMVLMDCAGIPDKPGVVMGPSLCIDTVIMVILNLLEYCKFFLPAPDYHEFFLRVTRLDQYGLRVITLMKLVRGKLSVILAISEFSVQGQKSHRKVRGNGISNRRGIPECLGHVVRNVWVISTWWNFWIFSCTTKEDSAHLHWPNWLKIPHSNRWVGGAFKALVRHMGREAFMAMVAQMTFAGILMPGMMGSYLWFLRSFRASPSVQGGTVFRVWDKAQSPFVDDPKGLVPSHSASGEITPDEQVSTMPTHFQMTRRMQSGKSRGIKSVIKRRNPSWLQAARTQNARPFFTTQIVTDAAVREIFGFQRWFVLNLGFSWTRSTSEYWFVPGSEGHIFSAAFGYDGQHGNQTAVLSGHVSALFGLWRKGVLQSGCWKTRGHGFDGWRRISACSCGMWKLSRNWVPSYKFLAVSRFAETWSWGWDCRSGYDVQRPTSPRHTR